MKNVVIAGGGDVGYSLAKALSEEGHNITVIERDEGIAEKLESLDVLVVTGNAASPQVLDRAYISSADLFIAVTGSDEINIAACAIAKNRGCKTMARVNGEDYIQEPVSREGLKVAGVDIAFCPDLISSMHMANLLSVSVLLDSPLIGRDMLQVIENRVDKNSSVVGKEIRKIGFPREMNLVAIFRNEEILIPGGNQKLQANDRVISLSSKERGDLVSEQLLRLLGTSMRADPKAPINKIMIAGGSRIGYHLARILSEREMAVILIEEDESRCRQISERLPNVLVVHGSPTDRELLKQEGLQETDAFLAVTGKEEVNILTSLLARQYGAKRSIGLVDRPALKSILEEMGIDLVVSPRAVTLSNILKHFHEKEFESMASLREGEAQVVEVRVKERSKAAGKRLDRLMRFKKKNILIAAIVRKDEIIIPRGDTVIVPGDRLVIFAKTGSIKVVRNLF